MHKQVAASGKHKYNLRLTFRLPVRNRLFFQISGILLFFIHMCKAYCNEY